MGLATFLAFCHIENYQLWPEIAYFRQLQILRTEERFTPGGDHMQSSSMALLPYQLQSGYLEAEASVIRQTYVPLNSEA